MIVEVKNGVLICIPQNVDEINYCLSHKDNTIGISKETPKAKPIRETVNGLKEIVRSDGSHRFRPRKYGRKCLICKSGKRFKNAHGLHTHMSRMHRVEEDMPQPVEVRNGMLRGGIELLERTETDTVDPIEPSGESFNIPIRI